MTSERQSENKKNEGLKSLKKKYQQAQKQSFTIALLITSSDDSS